jgi:lipoate-protein ligase A
LRQRLATIAELLGRTPDPGEIESVVTAALAQAFRRTPDHGAASPQELLLAEWLHRDELGLDAFVETMGPLRAGKALMGRDGSIQAHIVLHPGSEQRIDQIWITGDFSAAPARAIPDLEAALRGVPLNFAPDRAIELLSDDHVALQGASRFEVAAAIAAAMEDTDRHARPS